MYGRSWIFNQVALLAYGPTNALTGHLHDTLVLILFDLQLL